jgi:hypothetical protein
VFSSNSHLEKFHDILLLKTFLEYLLFHFGHQYTIYTEKDPETLGLWQHIYNRIDKHQKYQGGQGNDHRINLYHPGYFGKVVMRHNHLMRNQTFCPTIILDKLSMLVSKQT